jgi:glycerol-3-phosphate dehydrogenase
VKPLDLVVIGGGITGLGVARLAARNGYSVALIERGDLASGASSATSHMLHGGLRYLEHGHFGLVREALHERSALSRMAPDLARPTRFLIPFTRGDRRPPWMVRLGLEAYDAFAGPSRLSRHATVRAREALGLEPGLAHNGLVGAGLYSDVVMDDAGLAVAVARDAAAHGALLHTYTEAIGARPAAARNQTGSAVEVLARDRLDGRDFSVVATLVVNATGAWTDGTRRMILRALHPGAPDPASILRPTRGVHLVFPRLTEGHGLLGFARADGRVFFVIPFGDHSLVGTTEVETSTPPAESDTSATVEELRYLRTELERLFPGAADVPPLATTSGVRPLLADDQAVGLASREHRILEEGPLLTLAGGKYTTFRVMARELMGRVARRLRRPTPRESDAPLPRSPKVESLPDLAAWAVGQAFARRLDDVIRRRSGLWLSPDRGRVAASALATAMTSRLDWSAHRAEEELRDFHAGIEREERLLQASREPSRASSGT